MATRNPIPGYSPLVKTLHWLILVLLLVVLPLGMLQTKVKDPVYGAVNYWHVTLGITLFWLMVVRVIARLSTKTAAPTDGAPAWTRRAANIVQFLLYVLLLVQPVLGLLTSDAQGFPLKWFDVIPLPNPIGKSKEATDVLLRLHAMGAFAIVVLVIGHIGGALYHHVVRRDDTLMRIL